MAEKTDHETPSIKQSKKPLYFSLALIVVIVASYFLIPGAKEEIQQSWEILTSDDEARIRKWVDQFGYFGPVVIVICMILQMFLLVIPTPLLMLVSILAYGPIWGSILILIAVFCASSVGYIIGAYLGPPAVQKILGPKGEKKVESFIEDYGFWAVIVTRLSPFLSNDAISFVGGMLRMGYWRFIGATLIGITPLTLLIAYLGEDNDRLQSGLMWGSGISLLLFILYVLWDKKRNKTHPKVDNRTP